MYFKSKSLQKKNSLDLNFLKNFINPLLFVLLTFAFFAQSEPCKNLFQPSPKFLKNPVYKYIYHFELNPPGVPFKVNPKDITTEDFIHFFHYLKEQYLLEFKKIKENGYKDAKDIYNGIYKLEKVFYQSFRLYNEFFSIENSETEIKKIEKVSKQISDLKLEKSALIQLKTLLKKTKTSLTPDQFFLVSKSIDSFLERSGEKESPELKILYKTLHKQAKSLQSTHQPSNFYIKNKKQLEGLDSDFIRKASLKAKRRGKKNQYYIDFSYSNGTKILDEAPHRALREKFYKKYYAEHPKKLEIIKNILKTKQEIAKQNHANNYLEYYWSSSLQPLSDTPKKTINFLTNLINAVKEHAQKDIKKLESKAKKFDGIGQLKFWDISYYHQLFKEHPQIQIPIPILIETAFEHFEKFLGARFKENKTFPVHKKEVKAYDVYHNNQHKGILLLDLFENARHIDETTYGFALNIDPVNIQPDSHFSVTVLRTYFKKGISSVDTEQVTYFFHEMGHVMQNYITKNPNLTAWHYSKDQDEFYSLLQEALLSQPDILSLFKEKDSTLKLFSHNSQVGTPQRLPLSIQVLKDAYQELLNLSLHAVSQPIEDLQKYERDLIKKLHLSPFLKNYLLSQNKIVNHLNFSHNSELSLKHFKEDSDILEEYSYLYSKALAIYFLNQYTNSSQPKSIYDNVAFKRRALSLFRQPRLTLQKIKKSGKGAITNRDLINAFTQYFFSSE